MAPNSIKIRAHHLLCMQNFKGFGYNRDFINNMENVIEEINSSPELELEIVSKCDIICSHCPHRKDNKCTKEPASARELKNLDTRVLKDLNLKEGTKVKAGEIVSLVKDKLSKDTSYIKNTCKECEWKEICIGALST